MRKKFLSLLLCLSMAGCTLAGCGFKEKTVSIDDVQEETVTLVNDMEVSAEPAEVVYTVSYATLTNIMQNVYNGMDTNRRNGGTGGFKDYVADNTTSMGTSEITLSGISASIPIFSADDVDEIAKHIPDSLRYGYDDERAGSTVVQLVSANFPDNLTYREDNDIALEAIFIIHNSTEDISEGHNTFVPVRFVMNADDPSDWRIVPEISDLRTFNGREYFYKGFEYGVDENFEKIPSSEIPFSQYYVSCFTDDRNYVDNRYRYCCVDNDNDPSHPYLVVINGNSDVYEFEAESGYMIKSDISNYSLDFNEELGADFRGYASIREAVDAYKQGLIKFVDNTWQGSYIHVLSGSDEYWNMSSYTKFNLIDLNNEDTDNEAPELICTNDAGTCFGVYSFDLEHGFGCIVSIDTTECDFYGNLKYGNALGTFNIQNGFAYYMSEEIIYIAFPTLRGQNIMQHHKYEDGTWSNNSPNPMSYEELCADINKSWSLDITTPSPVSYPYDKDSVITAISEY